MKTAVLLIISLLSFAYPFKAAHIDSLESVLQNQEGTERIATLKLLTQSYMRKNPEQAIAYGKQAIALTGDTTSPAYADLCYLIAYPYQYFTKQTDSAIYYYEKSFNTYLSLQDTLNTMKTSTMYGLALQKHGEFKRASDIQNTGLLLFDDYWKHHKNDGSIKQVHKGIMLSNMSINLRQLGLLDSALSVITQVYAIYQEIGAPEQKMGFTLINIGDVYLLMNRNDNAIRCFMDAEEKFKLSKDSFNLTKAYNNIGLAYKQKGDTLNAIKYYNISLDLNRKINNLTGITSCLINLSSLYDPGKDFNKMETIMLEAVEKSKKVDNVYFLSVAYQNLASLYLKSGMTDKALAYALKTNELLDVTGVKKTEQLNYQLLSKIYAQKGDYKKAYEYHKLFKEVNDEIYNKESTEKYNNLHVAFETELKEHKIELLQKEKEKEILEKQALSRQKHYYRLGVGMLLVIMLVSGFAFYMKRKKDHQIQLQKELVHQREKELARSELEKSQIKEQELNLKLEYKSKQLTSHALNMMKKNQFLQEVEKDLAEISKVSSDEVKQQLRKLNQSIRRMNKTDKDWELFKNYFEEVNQGFYARLAERFKGLTSNDYKILALVKLNMNIKETASVLNISPDSVKTARYRLRKKLSMNPEEDLYEFVSRV